MKKRQKDKVTGRGGDNPFPSLPVSSSPSFPVRSRPWSLAARLTVYYSLSSFVLVLVATGYLYWVLGNQLDRENDRFLAEQALPLVNLLRDQPPGTEAGRGAVRRQVELVQEGRQDPNVWMRDPNVWMRVLDERQDVVAGAPSMALVFPGTIFPEPQPFDRNGVEWENFRAADGAWFRIVALKTPSSFTIHMALDRRHEENLLADYRRNLWLVLGAALLVCSAGSYQLARRGIRPVHDVANTAGHIRSSTLHERIVAADLPSELRSLADSFNEMLDRLESSFGRLAQFAADLAHELRTPINNLRGEAEVALSRARTPEEYREVLGSALEEYDRLARLIDSLLFLARAENPARQIQREQVDVGQELRGIRDFYEAAAAEAGVLLAVSCPDKIVGILNRTMLQRAVGNLVSNALRHTPAQGSVTMSARRQDGSLQIDIADTGSGIAPAHLPRLFDRFYRADEPLPSRERQRPESYLGQVGNIGLGLAIVKGIVDMHGGSAAIVSEPGQGTKVTLSFPDEANPAEAVAAAKGEGGQRVGRRHQRLQ